MTKLHRAALRGGIAGIVLMAVGCANGGLGSVLGSVLGGGGMGQGQGQSGQLNGYIAGVDQRSQQVAIQQSNGRTITVSYDNQTQVVYQNQNYQVSALQNGDQVVARVQNGNNGGDYTDLIQVTESVSNRANGAGNVQSFQGTVRQVDANNGSFVVDAGNGSAFTAYMPYRASSGDVSRFQNLRRGDLVRFYGVIDGNSRVQLRQFY